MRAGPNSQRRLCPALEQTGTGRAAEKDFIQTGLTDHPDAGPAFGAQGDQIGPERQAGDEGAGAVDRIQDPDVVGLRPVLAIFLADDPVIGISGCDQGAERRLCLTVGLGDRIEGTGAALVGLLKGTAEIRQGDARSLAGQLDGEQFLLGHREGLGLRAWGLVKPIRPSAPEIPNP